MCAEGFADILESSFFDKHYETDIMIMPQEGHCSRIPGSETPGLRGKTASVCRHQRMLRRRARAKILQGALLIVWKFHWAEKALASHADGAKVARMEQTVKKVQKLNGTVTAGLTSLQTRYLQSAVLTPRCQRNDLRLPSIWTTISPTTDGQTTT